MFEEWLEEQQSKGKCLITEDKNIDQYELEQMLKEAWEDGFDLGLNGI